MNISDKAKSIIGAVAPLLGTAIGGPFGAVAGTFIGKALGVDPNDPNAVETAVASGNPDVLVRLRQADNEFKTHMADVGLSEDKLAADDRANARSREIALKDWTPAILAYGITLGFFGTLLFMLLHGKPETGGDALLVMLGSLGTAWAAICSYYFGSSAGSAAKTDTINKIATSKS